MIPGRRTLPAGGHAAWSGCAPTSSPAWPPPSRHPLPSHERLRAAGRPAAGPSRSSTAGLERGDKHQVLLGVTGSGKTFTMASVIARREPPDAGPGPQQDAGRPALPGVQGLLPGERGRVLRLLLRLLPARGLRPAVRHLHREGSDDQRRDRPHAALRHAQPVRAARRGDRGLRLLHLRPRLARGLLRDAALRAPGRHPRPPRPPGQAGGGALRPQRLRAEARHLPGARRHGRDRARLRGERASASSSSATRSSRSAPSTR